MEDTGNRRETPRPPSGFSSWLDFAVETFNARGAEVPLLLEDQLMEQRMFSVREAARRELAPLPPRRIHVSS